MFAESINKLKKRATQVGSQIFKPEDLPKDEEPETFCGPDDGFVWEGMYDGPVLVRYAVQNGGDDDREGGAFPLPQDEDVTVRAIRRHFPLAGHFHLRFKAPAPDVGIAGHVWIDIPTEEEAMPGNVPMSNGMVIVKALEIPDEAEFVPASPLSSETSYTAPMNPSQGIGSPSKVPSSASSIRASPVQQQVPVQAAAPDDLLEMNDEGFQSAPAVASVTKAAPAPPPPKVVMPDRDVLVARREAEKKAQIEEALNRKKSAQLEEEKMKSGKVEANFRLAQELDRWAKTADGQSFKDIRTLLSTMHEVIWEGSDWQPLSLSELVAKESNIKKYYRKAITISHPDKQQSMNPEAQVRADRIFQALNEAYKSSTG